ncbi:MAG: hypothetical protein K2Z81_26085 [Cyanobacteria bacterium]|nr:hypothetical protein [Cyanobacteriota bacterium]
MTGAISYSLLKKSYCLQSGITGGITPRKAPNLRFLANARETLKMRKGVEI